MPAIDHHRQYRIPLNSDVSPDVFSYGPEQYKLHRHEQHTRLDQHRYASLVKLKHAVEIDLLYTDSQGQELTIVGFQREGRPLVSVAPSEAALRQDLLDLIKAVMSRFRAHKVDLPSDVRWTGDGFDFKPTDHRTHLQNLANARGLLANVTPTDGTTTFTPAPQLEGKPGDYLPYQAPAA